MLPCFACTVLQKHYRTLEALALEHEEVEEIDDLTQPDFAHVEKRAGTAIEEFKQLVYPAGYDSSAKPLKRKVIIVSELHGLHFQGMFKLSVH